VPTYQVNAEITISVYTIVEADSEEQAKQFALDLPVASLCHQCADNGGYDQWSPTGELDGDPAGSELTVVEQPED